MTDKDEGTRLRAGKPEEVQMGKGFDASSAAQGTAALIGERASQFVKKLPKGQRMVVHASGHPFSFLMVRIAATSTEHVLVEGVDDNGQPVEILAKPESLIVSFSAKAVS